MLESGAHVRCYIQTVGRWGVTLSGHCVSEYLHFHFSPSKKSVDVYFRYMENSRYVDISLDTNDTQISRVLSVGGPVLGEEVLRRGRDWNWAGHRGRRTPSHGPGPGRGCEAGHRDSGHRDTETSAVND